MNNIFENVKANIDTLDAVKFYGLQVSRSGMACCPFHDDKHPSLKIYDDGYYCFGCGASGDVTDFVSRLYGISQFEAAKKLSYDFGLSHVPLNRPSLDYKSELSKRREFEEWEKAAFKTVLDYLRVLQTWRTRYAPKSQTDIMNPRFEESLLQMSRVEYLCDVLTFGSKEDKKDLYECCRDEIDRISQRLKEINKTPVKKKVI